MNLGQTQNLRHSPFDITLGFFSSSAISLFASGFAVFLYNKGRMRLNINTAITQEDQEAFRGEQSNYFPIKEIDLNKGFSIICTIC